MLQRCLQCRHATYTLGPTANLSGGADLYKRRSVSQSFVRCVEGVENEELMTAKTFASVTLNVHLGGTCWIGKYLSATQHPCSQHCGSLGTKLALGISIAPSFANRKSGLSLLLYKQMWWWSSRTTSAQSQGILESPTSRGQSDTSYFFLPSSRSLTGCPQSQSLSTRKIS